MENGKQGAFACVDSQKQYLQEGLTKREYASVLAMQGILASRIDLNASSIVGNKKLYAKASIELADEILKQLEL
jgi:hypothetical protein